MATKASDPTPGLMSPSQGRGRLCYNRLVPKVGVEPTLPKEREFESRASASSATSAPWAKYIQSF
jgi:hypothetical protein